MRSGVSTAGGVASASSGEVPLRSEEPVVTPASSQARSLTVVHVIDALNPGGAERVLLELVGKLRARAKVFVCVTRESGNTLVDQIPPDVVVWHLERRRAWDFAALRRFRDLCRENHVDIVHAHGRGTLKFCAAAQMLLRLRAPIVFHDHYGLIEVDRSIDPALRYVLRKRVAHYIGVSPSLCEWAAEKGMLPVESVSMVGNAIDLQRFRTAKPVGLRRQLGVRQPVLAAAVATLREQKDHRVLFEAIAQSPILRDMLHVLLVGTDLNDEYSVMCRETVVRLNIGANVTFLGPRLDVPDVLAGCDAALITSFSESGPIALLEYVAAGLPFVATRTGQIARRLDSLGAGRFCPPGAVTEFRSALEHLITNLDDERVRAAAVASAVFREFDIDAQIGRLDDIYDRAREPRSVK